MKKILGVALAVLFAVPVVASAADVTGTITSIDRGSHSFVLSDGTQLTVSDNTMVDLKEGDSVRASYEIRGGKSVLIGLEHRAADYGALTSIWDEIQAGGDE